MSTLHVRNVPDDIYEALRARADEHDSSIAKLARVLRARRQRVRLLSELS
ncbi:MAG TPA: hypothetical protein VF331_14580 [Polyangiales bacterium]